MQHVIRFNAHISWEGQSNGLPEVVYTYLIFNGSDSEEINKIIEAQTAGFISMQAIVAQKDQGAIIDVKKVPQDRMLVPFRWITKIDVTVTALVGEMTNSDENGVELLTNGDEPIKQ